MHPKLSSKRALALWSALLSMLVISGLWAQALPNASVYLPLIVNVYPPPPSETAPLLLTEALYNPSGSEPGGEWVEIYNPGPGEAILSAYKVGDEERFGYDEGMMQFPEGARLPAGGVVIVANRAADFRLAYGFPPDYEIRDSDPGIPNMRPYFGWSTGSTVTLRNTGDEVLLLDGEDNLLDSLSWGDSDWENSFDPTPPPAADGQSLERSPAQFDSDTAADWRIADPPGPYQLDLSTPTPTPSPTPVIPVGETTLLVSEVLYDPSGADPAGEWIEIYNAGPNNAALWLYRIGDEETQGGGEGMYAFPAGSVLLTEETAIIAHDALTFESIYGFAPDFEITDSDSTVPNLIRDSDWGSGSLNLSASGDDVLLLYADDTHADGVSWGNSSALLDPPVPDVAPDHSIERYPPDADTDTAADWRDQDTPSPGTVDHTPPTPTPTPTLTPTPEPLPSLIINEIHADPADGADGDANGDGTRHQYEDEFIEIVNTTAQDIDVSGWVISDSVQIRHVFTSTTVISAECSLVVFGGGMPAGDFGGAQVQVASTGRLELNNAGDTLTLADSGGAVMNAYTYGSEGGDDQSLTRSPDIDGHFVKHSEADGSGGTRFSPGTRLDGMPFSGCLAYKKVKSVLKQW